MANKTSNNSSNKIDRWRHKSLELLMNFCDPTLFGSAEAAQSQAASSLAPGGGTLRRLHHIILAEMWISLAESLDTEHEPMEAARLPNVHCHIATRRFFANSKGTQTTAILLRRN